MLINRTSYQFLSVRFLPNEHSNVRLSNSADGFVHLLHGQLRPTIASAKDSVASGPNSTRPFIKRAPSSALSIV